MGLKYYLNLFKTGESEERYRMWHYVYAALSFGGFMLLFACFQLRTKHIIASAVCGLVAVAAIILARILNGKQRALANTLMKSEALDESDEVDTAFIAYRAGHSEYMQKRKRQDKKMLPLEILWAALGICLFPLPIILTLAGRAELADKIYHYATLAMIGYFFLMVIGSIIFQKNTVWYQDYTAELAVINRYKEQTFGRQAKYKLLEDKKPYVQFDYLYPDSALRKRFKLYQKMISLSGFFVGAGIPVGLIILPTATSSLGTVSKTVAYSVYGVLFSAVLALFITSMVLQKVISRKQVRMLKAEMDNGLIDCADKNKSAAAQCLELHNLRTPFQRRWNLIFLFGFLGIIILNIVLAGVTSWIFDTGKYGWIFFLLLLAEVVALFVLWFKAFARVRQKMIQIEGEIDRLQPKADVLDLYI